MVPGPPKTESTHPRSVDPPGDDPSEPDEFLPVS